MVPDNYYLKLDLSNIFLHKTIYKCDYDLIDYVSICFSFDHIDTFESKENIDLLNVALYNFKFDTNSNVKVKHESNSDLTSGLQEKFLFDKKIIKKLLNNYLIGNDFNSVSKNLLFKRGSSSIYFEYFLNNFDYQTFFPEILKKKLNYIPPKIILKVFFKKNMSSFLHF